MRLASLLALSAALLLVGGCGLVLDTAPADPRPDSGPAPGCTDDAQCDDGNVCNGIEACAQGRCVRAGGLDCDDGLACTADACDATKQACVHLVSPGFCPLGTVCQPNASPATVPSGCVPAVPCTGSAQCDDGNPCNGVETCLGNVCQPGTAVVCPSTGCLSGVCRPADGSCTQVPHDSNCEDGLTCTVGTCDPNGHCTQTPVDAVCTDAYGCTKDFCTGLRVNATDTTGCIHFPNDDFCANGTDPVCVKRVCAPAGTLPGSDTGCALEPIDGACGDGERCNFEKDGCEALPAGCDGCDDGNPCNGTESCAAISPSGPTGICHVVPNPACDPIDPSVAPCRERYCSFASGDPVCAVRIPPVDMCWDPSKMPIPAVVAYP